MAKAMNDRYTQFFTPAEFKAFNEALDPADRGHRRDDPARCYVSGFVRVTYVFPRTPAERAGLAVGDLVTAVNGRRRKACASTALARCSAAKPEPSSR